MKRAFGTLQAARAVAALAVVGVHSLQQAQAFGGEAPRWLAAILSQGGYGVDFFFVLSGFIIYHAHGGDERTHAAAGRFAWNRAMRIYLPYLPVSIGMILLYTMLPNLSASDREWGLLTSLTLLPSNNPPALSVAWTLVHEVIFYTIFLLFYATRRFWWLMGAWAAALFVCSGADFANPVLRTLLNPINLEFLFGMVAAVAVRQANRGWCLPVGLLGIAAYFANPWLDSDLRVWFGMACAFVVVGLVSLEREGRIGAPRLLVGLGDASYAIYLLHNPLLSALARLVPWWPAIIVLSFLAASLAGTAYHRLYEKPVLSQVRRARLRFSPGGA